MNYRIFVDVYGNTHYYRKQISRSTALSLPISSTDIIIPVAPDVLTTLFNNDLAALNRFNNNASLPQTVWVGNERIEFFSVDLEPNNNKLVQCIRGTAGTSAVAHPVDETVWDGSQRQSLLFEAAKTGSEFTVEEVGIFPWNSDIEDFLSQT